VHFVREIGGRAFMNQQDFEKLEAAIKKLAFSKYFTDDDYEQFKTVYKDRNFKKGQKILWRGQKGFFFFIIGQGKVSIRVTDKNKKEKVIAVLGQGDFVGEISLLYNRPRVADCYAEDDETLLFFLSHRNFFDTFIKKPEVRAALEQIAQSRMQQTKDIVKESTTAADGLAESDEKPLIRTAAAEPAGSVIAGEPSGALTAEDPSSAVVEKPQPVVIPDELSTSSRAAVIVQEEVSDSKRMQVPPSEETALTSPEKIEIPVERKIERPVPASVTTALFEEALKRCNFWQLLRDDEREKLGNRFRQISLARGSEYALGAGEEQQFVIVGKGEVSPTYVDSSGKEFSLDNLKEGEFYGEIPLLFNLNHLIKLNAESDSILFVLDRKGFFNELAVFTPVLGQIEIRAFRRVFHESLRFLSTHPHFEASLKNNSKKFSLLFFEAAS
jgi:CRP-like cAMP-binding protein